MLEKGYRLLTLKLLGAKQKEVRKNAIEKKYKARRKTGGGAVRLGT